MFLSLRILYTDFCVIIRNSSRLKKVKRLSLNGRKKHPEHRVVILFNPAFYVKLATDTVQSPVLLENYINSTSALCLLLSKIWLHCQIRMQVIYLELLLTKYVSICIQQSLHYKEFLQQRKGHCFLPYLWAQTNGTTGRRWQWHSTGFETMSTPRLKTLPLQ